MGQKGRRAVFLDRDGVLNRELGDYVKNAEDFSILPHAAVNCLRLHEAGFALIVITNQGGIARGFYSHEELGRMHTTLSDAFAKSGIPLAGLYYCPHHPEVTKCLCRKPGSLLIEKAIARHGIDASGSFMIGDTPRDMEAAAAAGVTGLLTPSNENWASLADRIIAS